MLVLTKNYLLKHTDQLWENTDCTTTNDMKWRQIPSSSRLGFSSPVYSSFLAFKICWITASIIGITIVTAETFWTHIEMKAQPDMKPSINLGPPKMAVKRSIVYSEEMIWLHWREEDAYHAGLTPTMDTSLRAILRWRPHFSMEVARHMTPMSRKWKSLKYVPATWQREREQQSCQIWNLEPLYTVAVKLS